MQLQPQAELQMVLQSCSAYAMCMSVRTSCEGRLQCIRHGKATAAAACRRSVGSAGALPHECGLLIARCNCLRQECEQCRCIAAGVRAVWTL
jgi:hypothetical protein